MATNSSVDPLVELAKKYATEIRGALLTIKDHTQNLGNDLSETVEKWKHELDDLKEEVYGMMKDASEQSPLDRDFDQSQVMGTFTWTGILLLAMTVGGALGSILSPLVICIIGKSTAFLLSLVLLPSFVYSILKKQIKEDYENDVFRRHTLLMFSFFEGFLIGFAFSTRTLLSSPPLAAMSAFAVGIPTQMYQDYIENNRKNLLGVTTGTSVAAHLLLGLALGIDVPYIVLALLHTATAFVILQLHIKNVTKRTIFTHMYQFAFVYIVVCSQTMIYTIFGREDEDMAPIEASHI